MKKNDKKNSNDSIKCDVENCKHNDEKGTCTLDEIKVSCTCDNCDCSNKDETICKSFDCKDDDTDDNEENNASGKETDEYEVSEDEE